jgi:ubiquinone/menaquinone biosynthesis C-methylase UbiE
MASSASRFDRLASSYEDNTLQRHLFVPVHQTTLQLALQLLLDPRRILDVGCGTGRLLRQARRCFPTAELVGVDSAGQMVATASTVTPTGLAVRYLHGRAECLPFTHKSFDLILTTLSLRHWTDLMAGIAEIGRVLTPGGVLVLADVFPSTTRSGPALPMRRRRPPVLPAQLGTVLAAHRLAVIGRDHTPWFSLPDVQVVAARKQAQPSCRHPRAE